MDEKQEKLARAMTKKNHRCVSQWETAQVTALAPGYRNVFSAKNGETIYPCPALLLQQLVAETEGWQVENQDGTTREARLEHKYEPPYFTRVVYADDNGEGYLDAACDREGYLFTLHPDEKYEPPGRLLTTGKQT